MEVTSNVVNLAEFKSLLEKVGAAAAEQNLVTAGTAGALLVQNAAKEKAPKRTRTLSRSIHTETLKSSKDNAEIAVGTDVVYAAIQEYGGVITPKTARMLAWKGADGEMIFAHRVTIKPHPYLRPAMDENKDAVVGEVGRVLGMLLEKAAK